MKSNTPVDKVMIQSNTQKALSGNEFQNSVFNKKTGEGAVSISNNKVLNEIRDELNTYKYIFEKDNSTGEYYLKEFKRI